MRILFDTNVVLDVLLAREPHVVAAAQLLTWVDKGRLEGALCATSVTTMHYLATKALGARAGLTTVRTLLALFSVAAVDGKVLASALELGFADYEDAVLHEAGRAHGVAGIVTRNRKDFRRALLPVYLPRELLAALASQHAP